MSAATTNQVLDAIWHDAMCPPDDREIWDWLGEEGELPNCYAVPGRLDISSTPFVREPWQCLRHPFVREEVAMAGIQCLKTLIGEGWLLWGIENDPGPTQWLQPTDEEATEHCEERFIPLIENFPRIHRFFSANRHDKKTAVILFQHMWMRMEGCGEGNLQRKSVKRQMLSEIHQKKHWKPGSVDEAASRLTQFTFNSKRYIESQPGEVERDIDGKIIGDQMLVAYLRGTQKKWCFRCIDCRKLQPFFWTFMRPDGTRAAMRWDETERTKRSGKSGSDDWIWGELKQTIRYECIFCGHRHYDEPLTRRRISTNGEYAISSGGLWVPQAIGSHEVESHNWNQLAVPSLNWFETKIGGVKNFLIAHRQAKNGFDGLIRRFFQKVIAEAYDPDKFAHFTRLPVIEVLTHGHQAGASKIVHDGITFDIPMMGVDVQQHSFFALVQIWNSNGDILNLWAGELFTWQEVEDKQREFKVPDQDVMVDFPHRSIEVLQHCTRHGHWETPGNGLPAKAGTPNPEQGPKYWLCWKAMRGADRDWFYWKPSKGQDAGKRIPMVYSWPPDSGNPLSGLQSDDKNRKELTEAMKAERIGRFCPLFTWARPTVMDFAIARRDGKSKARLLTARGEWNDLLAKHWHSQKKVQHRDSFGQTKWRFERFRDDHLLDAFLMILVRAAQKQIWGPEAIES